MRVIVAASTCFLVLWAFDVSLTQGYYSQKLMMMTDDIYRSFRTR